MSSLSTAGSGDQKGGIRLASQPSEVVIPAFNIPYLPMMEPVISALHDTDSFGFIAVARLEWVKFKAGNMRAVYEQYQRFKCCDRHTRLHLDHIPVIDEDNQRIDYEAEIKEAIGIGYQSVMVDGSRLPLDENIQATRRIVDIARRTGIPVEGELGAVFGHESGPLPSYEELFTTGRGFTAPGDALRFVAETGVDWLSVAVGSIHGPLSPHAAKVQARLDLEHLERIHHVTRIPLVLHGGSGIPKPYIMGAIQRGIAKINIGTVIRRSYESASLVSAAEARRAVYEMTKTILTEDLELRGTQKLVHVAD